MEACCGERCNISSVACASGPETITTELVSAGLLRKATPKPSANNSGKANTQNKTSGSRLSSRMRAARRCEKPAQRPLYFGEAVLPCDGVTVNCFVVVIYVSNFASEKPDLFQFSVHSSRFSVTTVRE